MIIGLHRDHAGLCAGSLLPLKTPHVKGPVYSRNCPNPKITKSRDAFLLIKLIAPETESLECDCLAIDHASNS